MSTQTITIDKIHPGMIIEDDENVKLVVESVSASQGEGLGILVIGTTIADVKAYSRRFQDVTDTVERTISGNPNDTLPDDDYKAPPFGEEEPVDE